MMSDFKTLAEHIECMRLCSCAQIEVKPKMIAITGGPGAGKTTFLDLARRTFCRHVAILPEAATIVYAGGFPRTREPDVIKAAQKSLWYVMRELEQLALARKKYHVILCDRGSLDGPAYWPEAEESFFKELKTSRAKELSRYDKVIYLKTPQQGYIELGTRNETLESALELDKKTEIAWRGHPDYISIDSSPDFLKKLQDIQSLIQSEIPPCCIN